MNNIFHKRNIFLKCRHEIQSIWYYKGFSLTYLWFKVINHLRRVDLTTPFAMLYARHLTTKYIWQNTLYVMLNIVVNYVIKFLGNTLCQSIFFVDSNNTVCQSYFSAGTHCCAAGCLMANHSKILTTTSHLNTLLSLNWSNKAYSID